MRKLGTVFCAGTVASQPPATARFRKTLRGVWEGDYAGDGPAGCRLIFPSIIARIEAVFSNSADLLCEHLGEPAALGSLRWVSKPAS